jgi:hypothetical protein
MAWGSTDGSNWAHYCEISGTQYSNAQAAVFNRLWWNVNGNRSYIGTNVTIYADEFRVFRSASLFSTALLTNVFTDTKAKFGL